MIEKKDVEHIARLARIELSEAELVKFGKDLSGALDFVGKLNEVPTDAVVPLSGGIDLINVMRGDLFDEELPAVMEHAEADEVAGIVRAAPARKNGYVKVKSVFN